MSRMERRLKERMVGAAILVGLVVVIVPEFLGGPPAAVDPPAPTAGRSLHTVTLDISHGAAAPPAAVPLPEPSGPVTRPAESGATPAQSAASSADAAAAGAVNGTAPVDPGVVSADGGADARRHAWSVQLGSFVSRANADNLVLTLRSQGFSAFELADGAGTAARYRVRIGPLAERAAAEAMEAKLKAAGHVGATAVPPGR